MKRDITFVGRGPLAVALGLDKARVAAFDQEVNAKMEAGTNVQDLITWANDRGDLTDAEWTCFIYALGYMDGARG